MNQLTAVNLPDDMILHMLQFLDGKEIIRSMVLVNSVWFSQSMKIHLCLNLEPQREQYTSNGLKMPRPNMLIRLASSAPLGSYSVTRLYVYKHIVKCELLENLTELNLSQHGIGDGGVADIVNSDRMNKLICLILSYNHISNQGVKSIACSEHMSNLTTLDLSSNNIYSVDDIYNSPYLKHLENFKMDDNGMDKTTTLKKLFSSTISSPCNLTIVKKQ